MKFPRLNCCALIAIVVFLLTGSSLLAGTIPNTLNYQGTLTDSTGKPVTATKPVTFKLYTSALGGTAFWSEPAQNVPVTNGQFSAVLGSTVPMEPNKFTGETYIGVTVDAGQEMLPRQKLTSVAYALKAADAIPKGVIVMWSGAVGQIPEGWALCDGANGTPNLRDRFIVGAGTGYVVGANGGESTHVLTSNEMPSHTHIQNAHNHTQNPHRHNQAQASVGSSGNTVADNATNDEWTTASATAINNPETATNQYAGGGAPHNNLPPYYALAFIMKL